MKKLAFHSLLAMTFLALGSPAFGQDGEEDVRKVTHTIKARVVIVEKNFELKDGDYTSSYKEICQKVVDAPVYGDINDQADTFPETHHGVTCEFEKNGQKLIAIADAAVSREWAPDGRLPLDVSSLNSGETNVPELQQVQTWMPRGSITVYKRGDQGRFHYLQKFAFNLSTVSGPFPNDFLMFVTPDFAVPTCEYSSESEPTCEPTPAPIYEAFVFYVDGMKPVEGQ